MKLPKRKRGKKAKKERKRFKVDIPLFTSFEEMRKALGMSHKRFEQVVLEIMNSKY